MRHVTDGELHAYLDGALDALSEDRADEVRSHLGTCAACKERLQDEERVRNEAQSLLSGVTPSAEAPPPFEAIRELATAAEHPGRAERTDGSVLPNRRRKPLRGLPLAWAATIVLALGVGWMGGQVWRSLPQDSRIPVPSAPAEAIVSEPRIQSESEVDPDAREVAEDVPQADLFFSPDDSVRTEAVPAEAQVGGVAAALFDEPSREGAGREAEESDEKAVSGPPPPVAQELQLRSRAGAGIVDSISATRRDLRQAAPVEARISPSIAGEALEPIPGDTLSAEGTLADAEGFGSTLAVPGLEILSMEWEEWIPGERGLNIRQLLPSGDTLELRYLGMLVGREPELREKDVMKVEEAAAERPPTLKGLEASLPPGWNQVTMRWGQGWLVARAPIPQETIRGLLRSIF